MVSHDVNWMREWSKVSADHVPPALQKKVETCIANTLRDIAEAEARGEKQILVLSYRHQRNWSPTPPRQILTPQDAVERMLIEGLRSSGKELWLKDGYTPSPYPRGGDEQYYPYYVLLLSSSGK